MPLFATPIADTSSAPNSRRHLSSIKRLKRKRAASITDEISDDEKSANDDPEPSPAASTNPLSLTPNEIAQYRLAGLALDQALPHTGLGGARDFPHRALPSRQAERERRASSKGDTSADEEDADEIRGHTPGATRGPALRTQHVAVLTAILQRCLQEGDIPRATRAWSILLRTQIGGKAIDIRNSGYWGIGAELLARSLGDVNTSEVEEGNDRGQKRWGTGEGLKKAIDYYQTLINTFPYQRIRPNAVGALDFWPAILGCKIYAIQLEQKEGLRRVKDAEEREEDDKFGNEDSDEEFGLDEGFDSEEKRRARRRRRREQIRWEARDQIRRTALGASEEIAATLKDLMMGKEYYSHALRRLRGMLALYIGDLSVPARPIDPDENVEAHRDGETAGYRMLFRQQMAEYQEGIEKQEKERALAREIFDTIKSEDGHVGGNIRFLYPDEDQQGNYDVEEW